MAIKIIYSTTYTAINYKKQQGVVLVVSLVFLIALTAVAAALMQSTTTDMKMSGASQDKVIANQEAISSSDEVIYLQVAKSNGGENIFARSIGAFPNDKTVDVAVQADDTTAEIAIENPNDLEADCAHSRGASSVQVFTCNVLRIQVNRAYGRSIGTDSDGDAIRTGSVEVNSGIAQELLR